MSLKLRVMRRLGVKDERAAGLCIVPLYAALSNEQQAAAFQAPPQGLRKVGPGPARPARCIFL